MIELRHDGPVEAVSAYDLAVKTREGYLLLGSYEITEVEQCGGGWDNYKGANTPITFEKVTRRMFLVGQRPEDAMADALRTAEHAQRCARDAEREKLELEVNRAPGRHRPRTPELPDVVRGSDRDDAKMVNNRSRITSDPQRGSDRDSRQHDPIRCSAARPRRACRTMPSTARSGSTATISTGRSSRSTASACTTGFSSTRSRDAVRRRQTDRRPTRLSRARRDDGLPMGARSPLRHPRDQRRGEARVHRGACPEPGRRERRLHPAMVGRRSQDEPPHEDPPRAVNWTDLASPEKPGPMPKRKRKRTATPSATSRSGPPMRTLRTRTLGGGTRATR